MPTRLKKVRNLITIKEYIKNKSMIINTPCMLTNGKLFYLYKNEVVPEIEFKKRFPTEGFVVTDTAYRAMSKGKSLVTKHIN
jgi:hypothetical protein